MPPSSSSRKRRLSCACESPPKRPRPRRPPRPPSLATLPLELLARIAAHLTRGQQTTAALAVAHASPALSAAVLCSLGDALVLGPATRHPCAWARLYPRHVRAVTLSLRNPPPAVLAVLASPCLRVADFVVSTPVVRYVRKNPPPRLRDLTLRFPEAPVWADVMGMFGVLRLETLTIRCTARDASTTMRSSACPLSALSSRYLREFAAACPNLRSLRVHCAFLKHANPIWRLLPHVPSLQEVTVEPHANCRSARNLQRIASVRVEHAGAEAWGSKFAMSLGARVTALHTGARLNARRITELGACVRLQELHTVLAPGAELALPAMIRKLPDLRSLKLSWALPSADGEQRRKPHAHPTFHRAACGVLLASVRAAPDLTSLDLLHVRLPLGELRRILRAAGARLRHLGTCVVDQDEGAFGRLEGVVAAVAEHACGLRTLHSEVGRADAEWLRVQLARAPDRGATERRAHAAMRALQRALPLLDARELHGYVRYVCGVKDRVEERVEERRPCVRSYSRASEQASV